MDTKLEAVIVLGGWLYKESDGKWRTMNFDEIDGERLVTGDKVRVVAANFLSKKDPNLKIIVSGSKGRLSHIEDCPTLATVLKRELIDLIVKPKNIIEENRSTGTFMQLKKSLAIAKKLKLSKIGIISNEYHLPRIKEYLKHIPLLNCRVKLISAEKTAIENDPKYWNPIIKKAYTSEDMKKRIALEKKGIQDLREGKYKLT